MSLTGTPGKILDKLAGLLNDMPPEQALICVPPPEGQDVWDFVKSSEAKDRDDVIARSRAYFPARSGPALFGLDFDIRSWPQELQNQIQNFPDQLSGVLASVAPMFGKAACLRRPSSSAGVRNRENGVTTKQNGGQHRFYVAPDGQDVARAIEALEGRLILAGYAYGVIFESGFIEVRSLIDKAVSTAPEHLWFEGRTILDDKRLEHVPDGRKAIVTNASGDVVDLSTIPDLTAEEVEQIKEAKDKIIRELQSEAAPIALAWKLKKKTEMVSRGVDDFRAENALGIAVEKQVLTDDFLISFDDGTAATVSEILADPEAFYDKTGPDPLEPEYGGGRNKAIVCGRGGRVLISSRAHGGIEYELQDYQRWFEDPVSSEKSVEIELDYRKPPQAAPEGFLDETPGPLDIFGEADPAELGRVPAGALPRVLERWVRSEARRKGVQPSFPALAAVVVTGSAVGASLRIAVRQYDDWTEPAGFWGAIIAPPGSTKTPVISAGADPLRRLDGEWLRTDGPVHDEWLKQSRKKPKADAPPLGPEPRRRRAVVDDVTFERLTGIFADNPNGLLRDTDELSGVFGSLGAYKAGADGDRSQLLRMFDGGGINRDRQTAGSSYAETALLSILAGSQPEKIRKMVDGLGTDGMLQRFLFVMHDGIERKGIDEEKDVEASQAYARIVRGLKTAEYLFPAPLRMSTEAIAAFNATADRLGALRHMLGAGPAFQDHVSKWGKFLPRLVLTFHAVEEFDQFGSVDPTKPIGRDIVEMAGRFARFLMLHSIRFYAEFFGTSDAMSEARSIAGYLLTRPDLQEITRRGVSDARTSLRGEGNLRALLGAMAELEASGWCEIAETREGKPIRWKIDPRIHVRYAARAAREKEERSVRHARIVQAGRERKRLSDEDGAAREAPSQPVSAFD